MKPVSLLTAALVTLALYLIVLERDALLAFAQGGATATAREPEAPGPESAEARVSVVAVRSAAREIDTAVQVRGRTEAVRQVDVRAQTSGLVISDPRRSGAFVEAGDILCEIEAGSRPAALAEAQARLAEAEISLNAATRLGADGFASETRVAAARAAREAAQAALEAARTEIDRLRIAAPFDGLLETDAAELGALMQPGQLCATVIQLDPIKLVGFVSEIDVARIATGARAGARLANGERIAGEVTFISRAADDATRTFRVEVTVPNPELRLRDGQTAEILIAAEGTRAHLLPQSALTLDDAGTLGVRMVGEDGRARFMPVRVERDSVDGVWLAGLPENAQVIVVGQEFVADGVALEVTYREAAQ